MGWVHTYIVDTYVWLGLCAPLLIFMGYCSADFTKALGDPELVPVTPKYFKSPYFWLTMIFACVLDGAMMAILHTTIKFFHPPTFFLFNVVFGIMLVKMMAKYKNEKKVDD